MSKFLELPFLRTRKLASEADPAGGHVQFTAEDDLDLGLYYLRSLSNVLRWAPDALWGVLAKITLLSNSSYPAIYEISTCILPSALP